MNQKYYRFLFVLFLALLLISCGKNDDPTPTETSFVFLESEKQLGTITQNSAQLLFNLLAAQFDDDGTMDNEVSSGAQVYKVTYNTTFEDDPLLVSGLISVPDKPGNYPVISFQNGTNVEYSKAPTVDQSNELFLVLKNFAALGFIVVIPDYPGFGESTQVFHPYLEKDNTLPSLVDLLKATREFVSQEHISASLNEDLYLMGYSQGGWSTMQLKHEIEQNGLEDYQLKATTCGAGPYNLNLLNELIVEQDSYPMPYFLAYLMKAYHVHNKYPNPLNEIFADQYAAKIPELFNGVTPGNAINDELTTQVEDLFQAGFRTGYATNTQYQPIQTALAQNSVQPWKTTSPTRLFHGEADTYVPLQLSVQMHEGFKALNVSDDLIKLVKLPGADHQSAILPFGVASINWFIDLKNK
ncbi:alpha/beta fold hydrolase [uncultured Sunxiuqinia sp.]|uniref:alpha/beta hydrolase family protein n=1 Tax=uncultured Sunxiuqinia sp. TaxID=1573825 RepID=UPI00261553C5|nr:alpha/beta fold hydrolase [uncultured Sunxiuqinia sp.]